MEVIDKTDQDLTASSKPSFLRRIGNRLFFSNGLSIHRNMVGLPLTSIALLYSFSHILYMTIIYFRHYLLCYIFPITFSLTFLVMMIQYIRVSISDPGVYIPSKEITNDPALTAMLATISQQDLFLRFCKTCHHVKDLRVFHCSRCDVCVLRHDHHCPYLSICIGQGNHKQFLILLPLVMLYLCESLTILLMLIISPSILHARKCMEIYEVIVCYGLGGVALIVIGLVVTLMVHQWIYISTNQTTSENIKRLPGAVNPFTLGSTRDNVREFMRNPLGYKDRVEYNANSMKYLKKLQLLSEALINDNNKDKDKKGNETELVSVSHTTLNDTIDTNTNNNKEGLIA